MNDAKPNSSMHNQTTGETAAQVAQANEPSLVIDHGPNMADTTGNAIVDAAVVCHDVAWHSCDAVPECNTTSPVTPRDWCF